jgi:hypothetical protein
MEGVMLFTVDPSVAGSLTSILSGFVTNIGAIINLQVGVCIVLWMICMGFRAVGVKKSNLDKDSAFRRGVSHESRYGKVYRGDSGKYYSERQMRSSR